MREKGGNIRKGKGKSQKRTLVHARDKASFDTFK